MPRKAASLVPPNVKMVCRTGAPFPEMSGPTKKAYNLARSLSASAGCTPGAAFGTNHSEEGLAVSGMADASPPVTWRVLMDRTMRWIVYVLGLQLCPRRFPFHLPELAH